MRHKSSTLLASQSSQTSPSSSSSFAIRYKAPKVIRNALKGGKAQREAEEAAAQARMQVSNRHHHYCYYYYHHRRRHHHHDCHHHHHHQHHHYQVEEVFEAQPVTPGGDSTNADGSSAAPQSEKLTIVDHASGAMTSRSLASDAATSQRSSLTAGLSSAAVLMNSIIFIAKVMPLPSHVTQLVCVHLSSRRSWASI
jgi:hypothetical protein